MALLDRNGVYGGPRFHMAAKKSGIKAHIGSEITMADGSCYPLLVQKRTGYQNLCRLVTLMKLRAKKGEGAATIDEVAAHAEGLICLTGGEDGPLAIALHGGFDEAIAAAARLVDIFGKGNVYAELQRHFNREEEARNQAVIEIARRLKLPLLATNGVCHATASSAKCLMCSPASAITCDWKLPDVCSR